MSQSTSDFYGKLYAIQPFKETESPPSSETKQIPDISEDYTGHRFSFKIPEPLVYFQPLKDLTPLRKVMSETCPHHSIELFDESNSKTLTSISSTLDILFSKIEKIKEEFSYALQKPKYESFIQINPIHQQVDTLFYSQVIITDDNKQNQSKLEQSCNSNDKNSKKQYNGNYSFPLTQHTQNSIIFNPFESFQESPKQKPLNSKTTSQMHITDFHLGKCIGSGKFGDVYICIHKFTGFICAIKKIFKSTIRDYNMQQQFTNELKIHYRLDHPNIIKLYGHFQDEYHVFLMMECANDGTLMDKLKSNQQFVSQSMDQVLDAIDYMHRNKVIHRDIKPENIVICLGTIKICDFGWASILDSQMKNTFCGTLDYVSPEMKDVGQYNQSVDLWSIGVLTFQMLAGFPPFKQEITNWKLMGSKRKVKWNWDVLYPPEITPTAESFINHLLKENPVERANVVDCKSSFFIIRYRRIWESEFLNEFTSLFYEDE